MSRFEIRPVSGPFWLENIARLRQLVWANEGVHLAETPLSWLDDYDPVGHHWAVIDREEERLVGAVRLTLHTRFDDLPDAADYNLGAYQPELPLASMNRLVIHPDYQGQGLGRKLFLPWCETAIALGARTFIQMTPDIRQRELTRLGFQCTGPATEDEDFPGRRFLCFIGQPTVVHARVKTLLEIPSTSLSLAS